MSKMSSDQRGFMLLSVVFLTLVVSMAGLILVNANVRVQQRDSTLRLTAINIANEQFAEFEHLAANGGLNDGHYDFLGVEDDLESANGLDPDKVENETAVTVLFNVDSEVKTHPTGLKTAAVTVTWRDGGDNETIVLEKLIRVNSIAEVEGKSNEN